MIEGPSADELCRWENEGGALQKAFTGRNRRLESRDIAVVVAFPPIAVSIPESRKPTGTKPAANDP